MKKLVMVLGIVFLLLSMLVYAQDETAMTRQLNERLERNKAEILKEIKDSTEQQKTQIQVSVEDNFEVMDERMQKFFKDTTRDNAVIVVAGFVGAFALSKVIEMRIERMRRKSNLVKMIDLSDRLVAMQRKVIKLNAEVRGLESLEKKLGSRIQGYKKVIKPKPFFNLKTIGFCVGMSAVAFVIGWLV